MMGIDYTKYRLLITYAADRTAVMPELESIPGLDSYIIRDENDSAVDYAIDKTRIIRNGSESLAVVLASPEEAAIIEGLVSLQVFVNVQRDTPTEDIVALLTPEQTSIMDRVNPRNVIDGHTPSLIWSRF